MDTQGGRRAALLCWHRSSLSQHCSVPKGPSPASRRSPCREEDQASPSIPSQPAQALQEDMLGFIPPRTAKLDKFLGTETRAGLHDHSSQGPALQKTPATFSTEETMDPCRFYGLLLLSVCIPSHQLPE